MISQNAIRLEAQKLRDSGYSYNMINAKLQVAKSTLSNWFKDRPFTPNKKVVARIKYGPIRSGANKHNRKVEEIRKLLKEGAGEVGKVSRRDLWLLGLGLYIGEGAKTNESVRIINSNPDVIKLSMKWFREICGLSDENITVMMHLYPDNDIEECLRFWRKVTSLSRASFRKTQIDRRGNKSILRKNKLPYGTVHLTVVGAGDPEKGVRLFRRINGWMSGAISSV